MTRPVPTVLLVEDDDAIRVTLTAMLRRLKVDVRAAADGEQALRLVEEARPDLILLDLMMPNVNGYQFLRTYRKDPANDTPVVIVSAKSDPVDRYWAQKLGVVRFVPKPFGFQDVASVVEEVLSPTATGPPLPS